MVSRKKCAHAGALLMLVVATFLASHAFAAERQSVYWAGVAFTGAHADRSSVASTVSTVIEKRGLPSLNQALAKSLRTTPPAYLALTEGDLAQLDGSTSAIVAAAAIDRDMVSVEPIGGQYKVLVEVALQALFFDYRERQIVAAFPLTLQRIDIADEAPDDNALQAMVAEMLYGSSQQDLPQAFARTLATAKLPNAASRRLQVTGVDLAPTVLSRLPAGMDAKALRATLAHEFSKSLSAATGVGLLPASSGEAIGNTMAARFADGKVYDLKIPAPDYAIHVRVDALKDGVVEKTSASQTLLFGAFFNVRVEEPMSGTVYFDQPLRKGGTKIVPATQDGVDVWAALQETLLGGFTAFGGMAAGDTDSRAWLSQQKPGGRALQQQSKALQELIQSCR